MAMGTDSAGAITRSARKLKDLTVDSVKIPSLQELADRKSQELADARRRHDDIVARQIKIEGTTNRRGGDNTAIIAEKAKSAALIERLQHESGLLKMQLREANPPKKLSPEEVRRQLFVVLDDRPSNGTPQQIKEAREAVAALANQARLARMDGGASAEAKVLPALAEAKFQELWLSGPPFQFDGAAQWLTAEMRERLNAMAAAKGKK